MAIFKPKLYHRTELRMHTPASIRAIVTLVMEVHKPTEGNKIPAIKALRECVPNMSLRAAKEIIEAAMLTVDPVTAKIEAIMRIGYQSY